MRRPIEDDAKVLAALDQNAAELDDAETPGWVSAGLVARIIRRARVLEAGAQQALSRLRNAEDALAQVDSRTDSLEAQNASLQVELAALAERVSQLEQDPPG